MHPRLLLFALTFVVALSVGSSVALAGGGNSENAKACQKNAWQNLQSSSGAAFADQSGCVSYAATGGTLFGPEVTATENGCLVDHHVGFDVWTLSATGFTPDSSVTINDTPLPPSLWKFDSAGSVDVLFIPDVPGVTVILTFTDGQGVHASVSFTPTTVCNT
jgi:hypothetical protein